MRVINVEWATTEDEGEWPDGTTVFLPREVAVPADLDDDKVADWLSDRYGWLVKGWTDNNLEGA